MFTHAYSFESQSDITIMTETQLSDLIAERRARGMSEENLAHLEAWHSARLAERADG